MSPWFEKWFRDDAYLALYGHRDREEARDCVHLILRATGVMPPAEVLDLASGPGRHAIELALQKLSVTAVDLSRKLLEFSNREAEEAGVELNLIELDMRRISFHARFDLAVQLFTSFGYFDSHDDDELVLRLVRRSLRDGGWYALDLINTAALERRLVPESRKVEDGFEITERREIRSGRVEKEIHIVAPDGGEQDFHESVRLFSPAEIEGMLRNAGLVPEVWYGDYHGTGYTPGDSPRMLVISRAG